MPSQVIAFTCTGIRQKYLRKALDSWQQARGIGDWHLVFCFEPCRQFFPVAEFTQWVTRAFRSAEVHVNDSRLGVTDNTRAALERAFARGAQFAVLAEEDCQVSDDVLEYFSWARGACAGDPAVITVCAHALHAAGGTPGDAVRSCWFNPIVWGTWRDRWEGYVRPGWGNAEGTLGNWDAKLRFRIHGEGWSSLFPVRSRSLHIGETSTLTPGALAGYFYKYALSSTFQAHREPCEYREIPFTEELGLVV